MCCATDSASSVGTANEGYGGGSPLSPLEAPAAKAAAAATAAAAAAASSRCAFDTVANCCKPLSPPSSMLPRGNAIEAPADGTAADVSGAAVASRFDVVAIFWERFSVSSAPPPWGRRRRGHLALMACRGSCSVPDPPAALSPSALLEHSRW